MSSPVTAPAAASRLSVHLAWGTISLRPAVAQLSNRMAELRDWDSRASPGEDSAGTPVTAGHWRKSLRATKNRLYWHDHFIQRLEDEPETEFYPINRAFEDLRNNGFLPSPPEEYQRRLTAWLTGINTIRVYNPTKQLTDHDRDARFVRAMVPELRHQDAAEIRALPDLRHPPYPPPVADYKTESALAKRYLYGIKDSAAGRAAAQDVLNRHGSRKASHMR